MDLHWYFDHSLSQWLCHARLFAHLSLSFNFWFLHVNTHWNSKSIFILFYRFKFDFHQWFDVFCFRFLWLIDWSKKHWFFFALRFFSIDFAAKDRLSFVFSSDWNQVECQLFFEIKSIAVQQKNIYLVSVVHANSHSLVFDSSLSWLFSLLCVFVSDRTGLVSSVPLINDRWYSWCVDVLLLWLWHKFSYRWFRLVCEKARFHA